MSHVSTLSPPFPGASPRWMWPALALACLVACALGLAVGPGALSEPGLRATFLELRGYHVATAFLSGFLSLGSFVITLGVQIHERVYGARR